MKLCSVSGCINKHLAKGYCGIHYRIMNRDYMSEYGKKWKSINIEKHRFYIARARAKQKRLIWNITLEEYKYLIQMPCHYCNNLLGKRITNGCGLDRLDSSVGYIMQNVVSCCYECNTMKSNIMTPEETKIIVAHILHMRNII